MLFTEPCRSAGRSTRQPSSSRLSFRVNAMNRLRPTLRRPALLLGLLLSVAVVPAWALAPGDVAPDMSLPAPTGTLSLREHAGKVVYVDFWASWCGPCRQSFPWMNAMQAKYGPRGFVVVGVNVDAKQADAEQFLATLPAQFPVGFDPKGQWAKAFGVKGMPTSVLIGRDGKVIRQHAGFNSGAATELEASIASALGARP